MPLHTSNNLGIPDIASGQAQPEATVNSQKGQLDALLSETLSISYGTAISADKGLSGNK